MTRKEYTQSFPFIVPSKLPGEALYCVQNYIDFYLYLIHQNAYIYIQWWYIIPPQRHLQPMSRPIPSLLREKKVAPALEENEGKKNTTSPHRRLIIKINLPTSAPDHKTSHLVFMRPSFSLINPVPIVHLQKKTKCFLIFIAFANLFSFHSTAKFLP